VLQSGTREGLPLKFPRLRLLQLPRGAAYLLYLSIVDSDSALFVGSSAGTIQMANVDANKL
jgi:hypothetical protein